MPIQIHWAYIVDRGGGARVERSSDDSITVDTHQPGEYLVTFPSNVKRIGCTATLNNSVGFITGVPGDHSGLSANQVRVLTMDPDNSFASRDFTVVVAGVSAEPTAQHCVDTMAKLKVLGAGVVPCVVLLGYYTPGDGGGGPFYWDTASTATDNGGTVIAPADNPPTGRWQRLFGGAVSVKWFGAFGNSSADDTAAILAAINVFRTGIPTTIADPTFGSIDVYPGGVVKFPRGRYRHTGFVIKDIVGLSFKGVGCRRATNYAVSATELIFTGTGGGIGIRIFSNGARAFHAEDIGFSYCSNGFTGALVELDQAQSPHFERCYFGDVSISSGGAIRTAESLVRCKRMELPEFITCTFDNAQRGIYIPKTATLSASVVRAIGCFFYDLSIGQIIQDDPSVPTTGEYSRMTEIKGCLFDPIRILPQYCLKLYAHGFDVSGNIFCGSDADHYATIAAVLLNGTGSFRGNHIVSKSPIGVDATGQIDVNNNWIRAEAPVVARGGCVTGKGNSYYTSLASSNGASGVRIAPGLVTTIVDMGPDYFDSTAFDYSYKVETDSEFVTGKITYEPNFDKSANGPLLLSGRCRLESIDKTTVVKTANYTLNVKDNGRQFGNIGAAGPITFTIPDGLPIGYVFQVYKYTIQNVVMGLASLGAIYSGTAESGATTLANLSAEYGAYIELEKVTSTNVWVVKQKTGTWA